MFRLAAGFLLLIVAGCDPASRVGAADATVCPVGYLAFNGVCLDDRECVRDNGGCDPLTECIDEVGGVRCGPCPPGHRGDGLTGCLPACSGETHDGGDGTCLPLDACAPDFVLTREGDCVARPACEDDDKEDDDDLQTATFFPMGETTEGRLCADDPDVFAVEVPAPCPIRAHLEFSHAEGDLDLMVVDAGGTRVAVADSTDDDEDLEAQIERPGTWYVVVFGFSAASAGYRLTVDVEGHDGGDGRCAAPGACSAGYALDANGACTRCAPGFHDGGGRSCVPEGACARGFHDGGDGTCHPSGACAPGHHPALDGGCVATVDCDPGSLDDGTGVCAPGCARGFHDGGDGRCVPLGLCSPEHQEAGDDACRPLGVCAEGFTANAVGVCLRPAACPEDDGFEPNPDFGRATIVERGERVDGVICAGDSDVFEFVADGACPVHVDLRFAHVEGDLDLEVISDDGERPEGRVIARGDSASDGERLWVEQRGSWFVRVYGFDGAQARYRLRIDASGHDGGDGACVPFGTCSPGFLADPAGVCSRCEGQRHDGGDGVCVPVGECSAGYHDGGGGACLSVGVCARGFGHDGAGGCRRPGDCAAGFHDGGGGVCVPEGRCLAGWALAGERCVCAAGLRDDGAGGCLPAGRCAEGFHDGGDGACVPEDACAAGHHLTPEARCVLSAACPEGERDDGRGACGPPGPCAVGFEDGGGGTCWAGGSCAAGFGLDGAGRCAIIGDCAEGFAADASGRCLPTFGCPADDPFEDDDTSATARPLVLGERAAGMICPGDVDVFVAQPAPDCGRVVRVLFDHEVGDLDVVVAGSDPPRGGFSADDDERVLLFGEAPTVLRVQGHRGAAAPYVIELRPNPGGCGHGDPICGPERHDGGGGACVPLGACQPGFADGGDGTCLPGGVCVPGFHDGGDGACAPERRCARGYHLDLAGDCQPTVACEDGAHDDGLGRCVPPGECAPDFGDGGDDVCVALGACTFGHHDGGDGACVPDGACAAGFIINAVGTCLIDLQCPDDDVPAAGPLLPGEPVYGVACDGRPDTFSFVAPADCLLRARLDFAAVEGDLALALLDAEGGDLERRDTLDDGERLDIDLPGAGEFGLRINSEDGASARYRLEIELHCGR